MTEEIAFALEKAKEFGYKIVLASIKEQNIASCKKNLALNICTLISVKKEIL